MINPDRLPSFREVVREHCLIIAVVVVYIIVIPLCILALIK